MNILREKNTLLFCRENRAMFYESAQELRRKKYHPSLYFQACIKEEAAPLTEGPAGSRAPLPQLLRAHLSRCPAGAEASVSRGLNLVPSIHLFGHPSLGALLIEMHLWVPKSKVKVLADLVPDGSPVSGLQTIAFLLGPHVEDRKSSGVSSSSYRDTNSVTGVPSLLPHLNLIISQRP